VRPLALHFLASFAAAHTLPVPSLADSAWQTLLSHDWPGNVRELASLMERLLVLHAGEQLDGALVDRELRQRGVATDEPVVAAAASEPLELSDRVHATERATIVNALAKAGGNRTLAARLLGVSRRTLYNKLTEHGIV
jgi:two-component system response regulator AtoC